MTFSGCSKTAIAMCLFITTLGLRHGMASVRYRDKRFTNVFIYICYVLHLFKLDNDFYFFFFQKRCHIHVYKVFNFNVHASNIFFLISRGVYVYFIDTHFRWHQYTIKPDIYFIAKIEQEMFVTHLCPSSLETSTKKIIGNCK